MKKVLLCGWIVALALILCACFATEPKEAKPAKTENSELSVKTKNPITETAPSAEENVTEQKETEIEKPAHSDLYLPEVSFEKMFEYFEELVLHMEYTEGDGNAALVQKWLAPLSYRIQGEPTKEDLAVLANLFDQLNEIKNFPGIYPAEDGEAENLTISFLNSEDFNAAFSSVVNGEDAYGAVQFWYYTESNEIHTANIGYRTDIPQDVRNSVLCEEIVNALGLSDTVCREDSIVYQYSDENTELSDVDLIIIKLLYDPSVLCGMDSDACKEMVEKLYY